jgi:hypothetical protein
MIKALLLVPILLVVGFYASQGQVKALNLFSNTCQNAEAQDHSAVCNSQTGKDPLTGPQGILADITNIVSYIAGAAAIIMLVYGSIKYITSGGDANNVKNAKDTVFFALIGIAVIVLARSLILFVLSKL